MWCLRIHDKFVSGVGLADSDFAVHHTVALQVVCVRIADLLTQFDVDFSALQALCVHINAVLSMQATLVKCGL